MKLIAFLIIVFMIVLLVTDHKTVNTRAVPVIQRQHSGVSSTAPIGGSKTGGWSVIGSLRQRDTVSRVIRPQSGRPRIVPPMAQNQVSSQLQAPELLLPELIKNFDSMARDKLVKRLYQLHKSTKSLAVREQAAYVLAGFLRKDKSKAKEAIKLYKEASRLTPLFEVSLLHEADLAMSIGDEPRARTALARIEAQSQSADWKARAQVMLGRSYLHTADPVNARKVFAAVVGAYAHTIYEAQSRYYLAVVSLSEANGAGRAISLLRQYLSEDPGDEHALDAIAKLFQTAGYHPTPADRDTFGLVQYIHGNFSEAYRQWTYAGTDKHWLEQAVCLVNQARYAEAVTYLTRRISLHPDDNMVPAASVLLMRLTGNSSALWRSPALLHSRNGDVALWALSKQVGHRAALGYYRQIIQHFPRSSYAPYATWAIFWETYNEGHGRAALAVAQDSLKWQPHSALAARLEFWSGKDHERLGEPAQAADAYRKAALCNPHSYYAYRSMGREAALSGGVDPGWTTNPLAAHPNPRWRWPQPEAVLIVDGVNPGVADTVKYLAALHQWDECTNLIGGRVGLAFEAAMLVKQDQFLNAINTASDGLKGAPAADGAWMLAYPLAFCRSIASECKADHVDPLLVHALIRQESRYEPNIVSVSNAIGLMQLLPSTAFDVARQIGLSIYSESAIYRPDINVRLGTYYLGRVLIEFKGQALLAVAGYNGGPNRVKSWVIAFHNQKQTDMDIFVEEIPRDETRDYVRKVFENYWNYQRIYR